MSISRLNQNGRPKAAPRRRPVATSKPVKALLTLTCCAAATAVGQSEADTSPYYLGVSQSLAHESNLLRLNEGAATPAGYSRSDTVSTTSLLAGIDQPISRQRLFGDVALRLNRYGNNGMFDSQTYSAKLGVDWATINRLSGTVALGASRNLSSFNLQEIGLLRDKNFEDVRSLDFSVRKGVVTQYSLYATLGWRDVDNSTDLPTVQSRNFRQTTGSAGVTWAPSDLLSLSAGLRVSDGTYPNFSYVAGNYVSDNFKRQDLDFSATWLPSGQSSLTARLGIGSTKYDVATQRNFDGVTGSLSWAWQATGKVRFNTSLSRDTGQDSYAVNLYNAFNATPLTATADYSRINTSLRASADWVATSKIALNVGFTLADRGVVRSLPTSQSTFSTDRGNERVQSLSIGARWAPTRAVLVGCGVSSDRIKGSGALAATNIKSNGVNCYGQFTLK